MDKKYAFLLALLITFLISANFYFSSDKNNARETVIVSRVIDGDTLETDNGRTIRLVNVNSPEKGTFHYELAKDYLKSFENKTVEIEIIGTDKYYRTLARIYSPAYVNLELVDKGLASKFLVQESELKTFSKAEEQAIKEFRGMWKKSSDYGCFSSDINKYDELVVLINNCNSKMENWFLKDESRKTYKFASSFDKVIIHSGSGKDNSTDVFIGSTEIWNNDRDTLYLFDSEGNIVHHEVYGY